MSDADSQGYLIAFREIDTGMKIDSWADRLGDFGSEMAIWAPGCVSGGRPALYPRQAQRMNGNLVPRNARN